MIAKASQTETIRLNRITVDPRAQSRAAISTETVTEYAELMQSGVELPPIVVFRNEEGCWLADGTHRYHAAKSIKMPHIECVVRKGGLRDAILFSAGSNATHGLRRTSADKRRAVTMLLSDSEWVEKSDRWIADACGVSSMSVASIRKQRPEFYRERTFGLDGKFRKASKKRSEAMKKLHASKHVASVPEERQSDHDRFIEHNDFRRATARDFAETLADAIVRHPQPQRVFELLEAELISRKILRGEPIK